MGRYLGSQAWCGKPAAFPADLQNHSAKSTFLIKLNNKTNPENKFIIIEKRE